MARALLHRRKANILRLLYFASFSLTVYSFRTLIIISGCYIYIYIYCDIRYSLYILYRYKLSYTKYTLYNWLLTDKKFTHSTLFNSVQIIIYFYNDTAQIGVLDLQAKSRVFLSIKTFCTSALKAMVRV